jgi:hypothetical protein
VQTGQIQPCTFNPVEAFSGAVAMRAGNRDRLGSYKREPTPTMAVMLVMSFLLGFGTCGLLSKSGSLGSRISERPGHVKNFSLRMTLTPHILSVITFAYVTGG